MFQCWKKERSHLRPFFLEFKRLLLLVGKISGEICKKRNSNHLSSNGRVYWVCNGTIDKKATAFPHFISVWSSYPICREKLLGILPIEDNVNIRIIMHVNFECRASNQSKACKMPLAAREIYNFS